MDGERLTDLRFADDVALTTPSIKDIEVQLKSLNKQSKKEDWAEAALADIKIAFVTKNKTKQNKKKKKKKKTRQTKNKNKKQKQKQNKNKKQNKKTKLPLILRKRVFNMFVLPTMTYGCETWTTAKYLEQNLRRAHHAMEKNAEYHTA